MLITGRAGYYCLQSGRAIYRRCYLLKLFVINPGSTTTEIAVFHKDEKEWLKSLLKICDRTPWMRGYSRIKSYHTLIIEDPWNWRRNQLKTHLLAWASSRSSMEFLRESIFEREGSIWRMGPNSWFWDFNQLKIP